MSPCPVSEPLEPEVCHAGRAGPHFHVPDKLLHKRPVPFRFNLDIAVGKIPDIAPQAELLRLLRNKPTEADPLNQAFDNNMDLCVHVAHAPSSEMKVRGRR